MDKATYEKLKKNPHYKMSDKQKKAIEDHLRRPMIAFGQPETHDSSIPTHRTQFVRTAKKDLQNNE